MVIDPWPLLPPIWLFAVLLLRFLSSVLPSTFISRRFHELTAQFISYRDLNSGKHSLRVLPNWKFWTTVGLSTFNAASIGTHAATTISLSTNRPHAVEHILRFAAWWVVAMISLCGPSITPNYTLLAYVTLDLMVQVNTHLSSPSRDIDIFSLIMIANDFLLLSVTLSLPMDQRVISDKTATMKHRPTMDLDSPEDGVTLGQWLTSSWVNPLLNLARNHMLGDDEVWSLSPYFKHDIIFERFQQIKCSSVMRTMFRCSSLDLIINTSLAFISATLSYAPPYFLKNILEALDSDSVHLRQTAYKLAFFSFAAAIIKAEVEVIKVWHQRRAYERTRGLLCAEVFAKAMRRKNMSGIVKEGAAADTDAGRIANLMNGDAYSVGQWFWDSPDVLVAPLQLVIAIAFLYNLLGWSCLVGLSFVFVAYGFAHILGKLNLAITRSLLAAADSRVHILSELVQSIRLLKLYAWEDLWAANAKQAREKELALRFRSNLNSMLMTLLWSLTPNVITCITFAFYTKIAGQQLTIPVAFTSIALFNMVQEPMNALPGHVLFLLRTLISARRLEAFFNEPDVTSEHIVPSEQLDIGFEDAEFVYYQAGGDTTHIFRLSCPTLRFPKGLSVISGATSSGKTSLLLALLNEMDCNAGKLIRPLQSANTFAYAAQEAWLEHGTIRDNITFGLPYDKERFQATIEACALSLDLGRLQNRDLTEIGERGISLSGGQRSRVQLARAVYSKAPFVLLDDPLAAVDAFTARHLLDHAICGPMMQNRTVILVTHHTGLCLPKATLHLVLAKGKASVKPIALLPTQDDFVTKAQDTKLADNMAAADDISAKKHVLVEKEARAKGNVKLEVYKTYLQAASWYTWALTLLFLLGGRGIVICQQWFLKTWGESYRNQDFKSIALPPAGENVNPWILLYFGISVLGAIILLFRLAIGYYGTFRAARILLNACLVRVIRAPARWHDVTPAGRVINRFSSDLNAIDSTISESVRGVLDNVLGFIASLIVAVAVVPPFAFFALFCIGLYIFISAPYVRCSRDLRRLENNSRSPMFSKFNEILKGLVPARAFGAQNRYQTAILRDLDIFQAYDHFFWSARGYLTLRFDWVGALLVFILTLIALAGGVTQGLAAFAIVSAQNFVNALHNTCWAYARLELDLSAVERIYELMHIPQEPPNIIEKSRPPAHWPSAGEITIDRLTMRYAPHLPPALSNVSFSIKAGERIGLVGRTGSGKSTLALSLLRVMDPTEGQIIVDGIDICKIGLHDLRERVTIISQEASSLFVGTVRLNLDPHGAYEDDELLRVCERVGIANARSFLDTPISSGGASLSQGTRQLLVIARAIVRRSNIFIADEATSAIDFQTDALIQAMLREHLSNATVITIAHRLKTVIDFDRILVLENGRVLEFDSPKSLLQQPNSAFRKLCQHSNELEELLDMLERK